jgi:hypothetical protein
LARTDINTAEKYVALFIQKDDLDAQLKAVKAKIAKMEEGMLEYMQRHGISKLTAGGRTVHLHRQIFASLTDKEAAHEKLREHGYGDLVEDNVNSQRLCAFVREEMAKAEQNEGEAVISSDNLADQLPLPADLKALIKVSEKFSVRVRK